MHLHLTYDYPFTSSQQQFSSSLTSTSVHGFLLREFQLSHRLRLASNSTASWINIYTNDNDDGVDTCLGSNPLTALILCCRQVTLKRVMWYFEEGDVVL